MEEKDPGKSGIQELVAGLAAGVGIDPSQLQFRWEEAVLVLPEHGLELNQKILHLRIFLEERSEVLSFSEALVRSSAEDTYAFVVKYSDYLVAALRKLKRSARQQRTADK